MAENGDNPGATAVSSTHLRVIAASFFRLGTTAFGGPAAHIAMMEEEFVRRRGWVSHGEFLDMLGATNLIPGPNSTEMAIHIGHQRGGWKGLVVGGACFIAPAVAIVMAAAWAYVNYGSMPQVQSIMYGIKPIMIAIVIQALWRLGPIALRTRMLAAIAAGAAAAAMLGTAPLIVLFGAGIPTALWAWMSDRRVRERGVTAGSLTILKVLASPKSAATLAAGAIPFSMAGLFFFFLKVGAVLYGSGYVLLAFLDADLVARLHWLTRSQLLDAVAIGQVTPGPVFTTATFVGYLLAGTRGGIVATIGIFIPSFLFVAASRPLLPRIRSSRVAGPFLDGVNAGALALMAAVTIQLGRAAIIDPVTTMLAGTATASLIFTKVNSAWLIAAGGLVGLLAQLCG
jgi:chromate transporter